MGAGTPPLRRLSVAILVCALSLTLTGCDRWRTVLLPPAPAVRPDRAGGVRLGVLFDPAVPVVYEKRSPTTGRAEVAEAVESGLVPFIDAEPADIWPRERIIAALAVRGIRSDSEGADIYADMRLHRGPGDLYSGWESPVRIRMLRRNGFLVVVGFERPGDGAASWHTMNQLFPKWVLPRLNQADDPLLVAELERVDHEFVLRPSSPTNATSSRPRKPTNERSDRPTRAPATTSQRPQRRTPQTSERRTSTRGRISMLEPQLPASAQVP